MYSNSCRSCSFEREIMKIGQSSHKMYSNNILNSQESMTILNACTKKSGTLLNAPRMNRINLLILKEKKCLYFQWLGRVDKFTCLFGPIGQGGGLQNTPTASVQRGKTPSRSVLDMTLNNQMMRLHGSQVPLHCHYSQFHSGLRQQQLIGSYFWVK